MLCNRRSLESTIQFIKHLLHLAEGMAVARPRGTRNPCLQLLHCIGIPACFGKSLRRHEISRYIVRILLDQDIEFLQRAIHLTTVCQFHGNSVSGEAVLGVQGKNLFKSCNFVRCTHSLGISD